MQKRQEYSTPIHARYYCPVPDCGLFVGPDKANAPFRRARCKSGHLTCMDCRQAAHADAVQCVKNQDMELVQRLAAEEGWRRCHRCHTMIEHRTACRHITCRCGAEFCSTFYHYVEPRNPPMTLFLGVLSQEGCASQVIS
jgi:hypothetical protein